MVLVGPLKSQCRACHREVCMGPVLVYLYGVDGYMESAWVCEFAIRFCIAVIHSKFTGYRHTCFHLLETVSSIFRHEG